MKIDILASGSSGNAYVLNDGKDTLLLECGIKWSTIAEHFGYRTNHIKGVLVSHEHGDHAQGVKEALKTGLNIYASEGTFNALRLTDNHHLHIIKHNKQVQIGSFIVMPFATEHDAAEPLGFLVYSTFTKEKVFFATDTYYIHWQFNALDYIMIECNYQLDIVQDNVDSGALPKALVPRLMKSHMSLKNCIDFLKHQDLSKCKTIYLLHLSDGNSNAEQCKQTVVEEIGIPTIVAQKGI